MRLAEPRRATIISGASAGGFTALRALTTNRFTGGASWYGITDLATFRTHVARCR
ncbi:MAG: alpha/beta hydrolase family protein [Pseudonocardiaceae bacterium]